MDPEWFLDGANYIKEVHHTWYPLFDIAHYAMACIHVRDDMNPNFLVISRKHPLACWISCMLSSFAGYILANLLLGEMPLAPLKDPEDVALASIVWYLIFYSPFDVVYKICKIFPIKMALSLLKEVQRVHKVHAGVHHTTKKYPHAYLVQVIIGVVKGAGAGFSKIAERFIRGTWTPTGHEFLQPTFPTKACAAAALLFVIEEHTTYITAPHSFVYLGVVIFFVYFKFSSMMFSIHDPFLPFENLFCAAFMGGVWDAITRALLTAREKPATKVPGVTNGDADKKKL